jgi:hypothetical protein
MRTATYVAVRTAGHSSTEHSGDCGRTATNETTTETRRPLEVQARARHGSGQGASRTSPLMRAAFMLAECYGVAPLGRQDRATILRDMPWQTVAPPVGARGVADGGIRDPNGSASLASMAVTLINLGARPAGETWESHQSTGGRGVCDKSGSRVVGP